MMNVSVRFNWLSDDEWLAKNHPELVEANNNSRTLRGYYAEQVYEKQMPEGTKLRVSNGPLGDIDAIEPIKGRIEVKFRNNVLKEDLAKKNKIKYYFKVFARMNDIEGLHESFTFYEDVYDERGICINTKPRTFWVCDDLDKAKEQINILFKFQEAYYEKFNK